MMGIEDQTPAENEDFKPFSMGLKEKTHLIHESLGVK